MKCFFYILLLIFATSLSSVELMAIESNVIENTVQITDSINGQTQSVSESGLLNRFYYFWSQKHAVNSHKQIKYQWRYQLLIHENNRTSRWVYDPRGFAQEISIKKSSLIYQFPSTRSFNKFLNKLAIDALLTGVK